MPLRRSLHAGLTAIVLCGALAAAPSSAHAGHDRCTVPHARVSLENAKARVWRSQSEIYACLRGERPKYIGSVPFDDETSPDSPNTRHLVLRGYFLAWEASCQCRDFTYTTIMRMDLRRRKARIIRDTVKDRTFAPTRALKLRRDGALAWVAADIYASPPFREVWKADEDRPARLDAGNISSDLRLRDGQVFWLKDGIERSSKLR